MDKKTKIWLVVAASLVLVGCILFGGILSMQNWNLKKLSSVAYVDNQYAIEETYQSISVVAKTADVVFVPSENGESAVFCHEQANLQHRVEVKDGCLTVTVQDTRKWYEYLSFGFDTPKITVTIPQGAYGSLTVKTNTGAVNVAKAFFFDSVDITATTGIVTSSASATGKVKIKTSTGSIRVEDVAAGQLEFSVTTGRVTASNITCTGDMTVKVTTGKASLTHVRCKNLTSTGVTGDLLLENVVATEKLSVKRTTGNVKLVGCDAGELFFKASTGYVKGNLLTDKIFIVQSDTGRIDVPKTVTGGRCEITTDTGDIKISIQS